jgi:hypothetical protein
MDLILSLFNQRITYWYPKLLKIHCSRSRRLCPYRNFQLFGQDQRSSMSLCLLISIFSWFRPLISCQSGLRQGHGIYRKHKLHFECMNFPDNLPRINCSWFFRFCLYRYDRWYSSIQRSFCSHVVYPGLLEAIQ